MATDPQTLLSQASCYICFGNPGTDKLMEIALMSQWAALVEGANPPNLIPPGATYSAGGTYNQPVTPNQTYHVTFSAPNTTVMTNGQQGFGAPQNNTAFTAQISQVTFGGIPGAMVQAVLVTP